MFMKYMEQHIEIIVISVIFYIRMTTFLSQKKKYHDVIVVE